MQNINFSEAQKMLKNQNKPTYENTTKVLISNNTGCKYHKCIKTAVQ